MPADEPAVSAQEMRALLAASDERLLGKCQIETYRASGPGGQKRNKTSSAVRLRLLGTELTAVGTESRSQHENKARALRRIRDRIALEYRLSLTPVPEWPAGTGAQGSQLHVSSKNPALPLVVALTLDGLAGFEGDASAAARWLGVTPTSLIRFLAEDPPVWVAAQRIRVAHGRGPLRR